MPGIAAVVVCTLAAACSGSGSQPSITDIEPAYAAIGTSFELVVTGNFESFAGAVVHVSVARTHDLFGNVLNEPLQEVASGQLGGGPLRNIYLRVNASEAVPTGLYSLHLSASGKEASMSEAFALLPAPALRALDRNVLCLADTAMPLRILGSQIPIVSGAAPAVKIATPDFAFPSYTAMPVVTPASCNDVVFSRAQIALCDELDLDVPADAPEGDLTVSTVFGNGVQLPVVSLSQPILVDRAADFPLRGPFSTADGETALVFQGGKFHRGVASPPSASVDDTPVAPSFAGCTDSTVVGESWCTTLSVPVPQGTVAGIHPVMFSTMAGCTSRGSVQVLDPPLVTSAEPAVICAAGGSGYMTIHGSGFYGARVFVGDLEGLLALGCPATSTLPASTCDTLAIYPVPACVLGICPRYPAGQYTLSVENGTTPPIRRSLSTPVTVEPGPPRLSPPSPANVFNGVDRQVFVRIENQTGNLVSAEFRPWTGGASVAAKAIAPAPGGALITVQAGLASQSWEIVVHDESANCPGGTGSGIPLFPQTSFVTYANDFEGTPDPYYVNFDSGTPGFAAVDFAAGNGGGQAAHYAAGAGPGWYFPVSLGTGNDLTVARFDLRRAGTGSATGGADVSIADRFFTLEAALSPAPQDGWTHYDVPLDDPTPWTYRAGDGTTRPATASDLRTALDDGAALHLRGSAYDGATDASLDNVSVELAH